ncbi:MAG TPA: hypothetical protein VHW23_05155 [Kofleriaceae bacterium]|nr:hypothetical protein [Kofleriaceae bacterium]
MPDDERKGRRLGDETKGRIADLASGWDSDAPAALEPPPRREASGPARVPPDAPRRNLKTQPPPPPGSAARKALEDQVAELRELYGDDDDEPGAVPRPPPPASRPVATPKPPRTPTGQAPALGKRRTRPDGEVAAPPEADRTKENRGAVGIKHDRSASLTTNAASGTISDTPSPIFDRAAIAAGQRGARAAERVTDPPSGRLGSPPGDAVPPRPSDRSPSGKASPAGTGPAVALRGSGPIAGPPGASAARRTDDDSLAEALAEIALSSEADDDPRDATHPRGRDIPASDSERRDLMRGGGHRTAGRESALSTDEQRLAVPVGEFDHAETMLEQGKRRSAHAQATVKRDAASALLGIAAPAPPRAPGSEVLFDEPTRKRSGEFDETTSRGEDFDAPTREANVAALHDASGSSTGRFERGRESPLSIDRGDPTIGDPRPDATVLQAPASAAAPTGTLRSSASLPRRRGAAGDLLYIATVILGKRRARREVAELTGRQATRQQSRRHHLITLGRAAVTADGFDHAALGAAREELASVEEERAQHAGHVVAADAELARVSRDREAQAKRHAEDIAALDTELAALGKKLEPLEKEVTAAKKRGINLHEALRRIDAKIAATEASLASGKNPKLDRAEVQAEIATLRADRKSVQSDEPVIAGQLDALSPRVAALDAARAEAERKRVELETAELDDQRRVEELLAAIGAKRKVVDRAAASAEAMRDKILFKLGERLYVDRPDDLAAELAPIDSIDLEVGSGDRRMMELREILASVDRWKLARGIALLVVLLAAIGALTTWLVILCG